MQWFRRLFKLEPNTEQKSLPSLHTVKFDSSLVTKSVRANLRRNIESLKDVREEQQGRVYEVALRSISAGRDLCTLTNELMKITGMPKGRAIDIASSLHNKASAEIEKEQRLSIGITHAIWTYANAHAW